MLPLVNAWPESMKQFRLHAACSAQARRFPEAGRTGVCGRRMSTTSCSGPACAYARSRCPALRPPPSAGCRCASSSSLVLRPSGTLQQRSVFLLNADEVAGYVTGQTNQDQSGKLIMSHAHPAAPACRGRPGPCGTNSSSPADIAMETSARDPGGLFRTCGPPR